MWPQTFEALPAWAQIAVVAEMLAAPILSGGVMMVMWQAIRSDDVIAAALSPDEAHPRVTLATLRALLHEAHMRPLRGDLLALRCQVVDVSEAGLEKTARDEWIELCDSDSPRTRPHLSDARLFERLGFTSLTTLSPAGVDVSTAAVPETWRGRFDAILDTGVVEQSSDLESALATLAPLLRLGGRIIHVDPNPAVLPHLLAWYRAHGWGVGHPVKGVLYAATRVWDATGGA